MRNSVICIPYKYFIQMIKARRATCAGHVACVGKERIAYRVLVIKPQGKRPLGRDRHRWECTIKIGLKEMVWMGRDKWWAVVNMVMNLQGP